MSEAEAHFNKKARVGDICARLVFYDLRQKGRRVEEEMELTREKNSKYFLMHRMFYLLKLSENRLPRR